MWLDTFEQQDGPLETSWGKSAPHPRRGRPTPRSARAPGTECSRASRGSRPTDDHGSGVIDGYRPLSRRVASYHPWERPGDAMAPWRVRRAHAVRGCLRRSGARTAIVSPGEPAEAGNPRAVRLTAAGRGGDVDPDTYGAEPDTEHNYGIEPDRDAFEIELLHAAERTHVPTLCICRGCRS